MTFLPNPCIMTGVTLSLQLRDQLIHGDLFLQGDQYIFNGVFDPESGNPAWWSKEKMPVPERHIELGLGCRYWERRGVFVIPLSSLTFSKAAFEYIKPALFGSDYILREATRKLALFTNPVTE